MGNCHVLQVSTSICLHVLLHCLSNGLRRTHTAHTYKYTYTDAMWSGVSWWLLILDRWTWFNAYWIVGRRRCTLRAASSVSIIVRGSWASRASSPPCAQQHPKDAHWTVSVHQQHKHTHMYIHAAAWAGMCALGLPHCCGTLQRIQVVFIPLILLTIRIYTVISINNRL